MKKKQRHNEIRLRSFKIQTDRRQKTIKIPCQWDEQIGEWMMTAKGSKQAKNAKLKLMLADALAKGNCRKWYVSSDFERRFGTALLNLARG
jgi:hypothetical protein